MPPTVDRHITDSWPIYHRHMTDIRSRCVYEISTDTLPIVYRSLDRLAAEYRPTLYRQSTDTRPPVGRQSTDCRPTLGRPSTDYRSTIDRLSIDYRPLYRSTVDRYSGRYSGRHYVAITYSKHDPIWLSENKIAKCIVSITLTYITESSDEFHNLNVVDNINRTNTNQKKKLKLTKVFNAKRKINCTIELTSWRDSRVQFKPLIN